MNVVGSAIALVYRFVSGLTLERLKVMPDTLVFISDTRMSARPSDTPVSLHILFGFPSPRPSVKWTG